MKKVLSLIGFVGAFHWASLAMPITTVADTSLWQQRFEQAMELDKNGKYDSAILIFTELSQLYENEGLWEKSIISLNNGSIAYRRKKDLKEAEELALRSSENCDRYLGKEHFEKIRALDNLAIICFHKNEYDRALDYKKEAIRIAEKILDDDDKYKSGLYETLASIYAQTGNKKAALKWFLKRLDWQLTNDPGDSIKLATTYSNLGVVYMQMAYEDSGKYYITRGLEIRKAALGNYHPRLAHDYMNLAFVFVKDGNLKKALNYAQSSLDILKNSNGIQSYGVGRAYNLLGIVYKEMKLYDKALEYYDKSAKILLSKLGESHSEIAVLYNGMGMLYAGIGDDERALEYLEKSKSIRAAIYGDNSMPVGLSLDAIAVYYFNSNDFKTARTNFIKSRDIFMQSEGEVNLKVSNANYFIAETYRKSGLYHEALPYYQKALTSNHFSFRDSSIYELPSLEGFVDRNVLLKTLTGKAMTFAKTDELNHSLLNFQLTDTLVDRMRRSNLSWDDKISLSETAEEIYKNAVSVSMQLYDQTKDQSHLHQAFYFTEKSKAAILDESYSTMSVIENRLIPEDLSALEKSILLDLDYFRSKLRGLQVQDDSVKSTEVVQYQHEIFLIGRKKDSLEQILRTQYPKYYQLKYQTTAVGVDELQKQIPDKTLIIEYIISDSILYTFLIDKNNFDVLTSEITDKTFKQLNSFLKNMSEGPEISQFQSQYDEYVSQSRYLYKTFLQRQLATVNENEVESLVIVPSGPLSYLPFEILLGSYNEGTDYNSLDYLIKSYSISYAYSAQSLVHQSQSQTTNEMEYLGYAPSYQELEPAQKNELKKFRNSLVNLEWNQHEVESVGKSLAGTYYLADQATETNFKEQVSKSNIVHLAMHALIDDQEPMRSKLVFNSLRDSLNDGFLHTYELFDLKINPELIVLSACSTGAGELEQGEGIISLAYGFAYAGCPSIVSSLWPVDDKSTSDLMINFYQYLDEGMTKSEALRQSKLSMINGNVHSANPYYWGAFVLIGNSGPLHQSNQLIWYLILGGLVVVVFIGFRKRVF
ncbi:MAG: CHAT domain-containing tetratricopeptide repeat protein [Reichenbachiella sp.]|uniref:CHAT domain-containing protein n=1 Tax=Reichenbachiella sp. TaxID=2184521 RepID=UPI003265044A